VIAGAKEGFRRKRPYRSISQLGSKMARVSGLLERVKLGCAELRPGTFIFFWHLRGIDSFKEMVQIYIAVFHCL
tara:strand:- start:68 stop:289 length:222 start_codon:yes stop_codon:yes gene_type:complete